MCLCASTSVMSLQKEIWASDDALQSHGAHEASTEGREEEIKSNCEVSFFMTDVHFLFKEILLFSAYSLPLPLSAVCQVFVNV